jgi:hypothetical protein
VILGFEIPEKIQGMIKKKYQTGKISVILHKKVCEYTQ